MLVKKKLILNRILYDKSKKKYKLIKFIIIFFGIIAIASSLVLYFFYDLRIITMSVIILLILYLVFIYFFHSRNYKLNILKHINNFSINYPKWYKK